MKQKQTFTETEQANGQALRQYAAPRVLSSEDLEAMAISCDPSGAGSNGKTVGVGCGTEIPPKPLGT